MKEAAGSVLSVLSEMRPRLSSVTCVIHAKAHQLGTLKLYYSDIHVAAAYCHWEPQGRYFLILFEQK